MSWMKQASNILLPRAELAACKYRFGVTGSSCCEEEVTTPCSLCKDGIAPEGWEIVISGMSVVNYPSGATADINGTHTVCASGVATYGPYPIPPGACIWGDDYAPCVELDELGNCHCTGHFSMYLIGRTLSVYVWAFEERYHWSYTFPGTDPIDCLNINGLSLGANCTVSAKPTECTKMVRDFWGECVDLESWINLIPFIETDNDWPLYDYIDEWKHVPGSFKVTIEVSGEDPDVFILTPVLQAVKYGDYDCEEFQVNVHWLYRGWGPQEGADWCINGEPNNHSIALSPMIDTEGTSGLDFEVDKDGHFHGDWMYWYGPEYDDYQLTGWVDFNMHLPLCTANSATGEWVWNMPHYRAPPAICSKYVAGAQVKVEPIC